MILGESNKRTTYLGCAEDVGIPDTMVVDHQFKDTIDVRQFHLDFVAMTLMEIIYYLLLRRGGDYSVTPNEHTFERHGTTNEGINTNEFNLDVLCNKILPHTIGIFCFNVDGVDNFVLDGIFPPSMRLTNLVVGNIANPEDTRFFEGPLSEVVGQLRVS